MSNNGVPLNITKQARIVSYDINSGKALIKLASTISLRNPQTYEINIPVSYSSNDGIFAGGLVGKDTPIIVAMGEGGKYHFISFLINSPSALPDIPENSYLISANSHTFISLNTDSEITIGSKKNKLLIDSNYSIITSSFDEENHFTETALNINGIIKRDLNLNNSNNFPDSLRLDSHQYNLYLSPVCLDPTFAHLNNTNDSSKNPAFVEKRELIYEFEKSANVADDITESFLYKNSKSNKKHLYPNRKASRADTLSLSLYDPNFLMETSKGTIVDIYGNILDINRNPLPIGRKDLSLKSDGADQNKDTVFLKIKEFERKSIAFHFELNARKDLSIKNNGESTNFIKLPDLDSKTNYARDRSRFYFDIDKEGLFKLNVPASSETGNIPLLTRYENYSTFHNQSENEPNKLILNNDNKDIYHDSFAIGDIEIKDNDVVATPRDRLTQQHIKHGTPFHSIKGSLGIFQNPTADQFVDFQYSTHVDLFSIPKVKNIVSPVIFINGKNANAGGRSGSINLDGSLEMSIGANTADRQSLWLDTAGGIIANVGRDKNNLSAGFTLDGDLLVQIGGYTVNTDSRFEDNKYIGGALDIRVLNEGYTVSIIRIDRNGITIASPSTISFKGRDITIAAEGKLILEGDIVSINKREVAKWPVKSI